MLHFDLSSEDCKGEVKLSMRCAMIGNIRYAMHGSISYAMHGSTNSIARQVGYSSIKAALRCSSTTCFAHKHLNAPLHSFVHGLQGRSQAFEVLRNDWEYPLRKVWKYKLCNAWKYPKYRKASGYSGIKAALRCSSAKCLAHKLLNASLRSFVHDSKGEVKLLKRYALIGNVRCIII